MGTGSWTVTRRQLIDALAALKVRPVLLPGLGRVADAEAMADAILAELPQAAPSTAIAFAVLYTITDDGEVEHTAIPPFVAEPILAAERARRDAARTGAGGAPDGSGAANSPAPVSGDTGTGSGDPDATEATP